MRSYVDRVQATTGGERANAHTKDLKEYTHDELAAQPIAAWTGQAYRLVVGAIRAQLAVEGLTQPHWWTLNHASGAPGSWTRATLTDRLTTLRRPGHRLDEVQDDLLAHGGSRRTRRAACPDRGGRGRRLHVPGRTSTSTSRPRGVEPADFVVTTAFLRDRTLVNEGRNQLYGTQIAGVKDGAPVPWPCAEPDRVDELRAEVGIEPFDEYVAKFSTT
ncbi:hypothetical protein SVIOM74S_02399 [Streptomyces violarus]